MRNLTPEANAFQSALRADVSRAGEALRPRRFNLLYFQIHKRNYNIILAPSAVRFPVRQMGLFCLPVARKTLRRHIVPWPGFKPVEYGKQRKEDNTG